MRSAIILLTVLLSQTVFAEGTILGRWKTIDDKTKQPKGIVEITEKEGVYTGRLVEIFDKTKTVCTECSGDKKNKPLIGLEIVWDLKKTGDNEWREGHIMDPANGNSYKLKVALEDEGKKLYVRGYLGVTWAGRTQYWMREPVVKVETPAKK